MLFCKIVSFCSRHGLSYRTAESASRATKALRLAVMKRTESLFSDGCFRICNGCSNYIHAGQQDNFSCGSLKCKFDLCADCCVNGLASRRHLQKHSKHYFVKGTDNVRCTLNSFCSCGTQQTTITAGQSAGQVKENDQGKCT